MKTKNIFKALALAMLMPAMLLTTACSSDDSIINDDNTAKKGYPLQVTVNVTRQGDKANTRATYNESTHKLEFSTGDQLFVNGIHPDAGYFAGTLDRVSGGTFSGTIITAREYSDTAEKLLNEASASGEDNFASATLLPSGYEEYDYFFYDTILEIFDIVNWDEDNAFARSKAEAVEQFTVEQAEKYENGFALSPTNAILSFTITGLTANTNVKVLLENIYSLAIKGEVTTDDLGTVTFAIGLWAGTDLQNYSLTVGGTEIALTSTSKTLEAGHIYNITRSAAASSSVEIVTWNFSGKSGIVDLSQGEGYTEGGVTLSGSGTLDLDNGNLYIEDKATFSNSLNKKFKSIDISPVNGQLLNWTYEVRKDGEYWAWSNVNGATYVYFYSSDTFKSQATGIKSIVFTLE